MDMVERYSKAVLIEALSGFQTIRPPRLTRQDKSDLVVIVRRALNGPMRAAMIEALDAALHPPVRSQEEG